MNESKSRIFITEPIEEFEWLVVTFLNKKAATFCCEMEDHPIVTQRFHSLDSPETTAWRRRAHSRRGRCVFIFCSTFLRLINAICGSCPSAAPTCMWLGGDLTNGHANGHYEAAMEICPLVVMLQKRADLYIQRGRTKPTLAKMKEPPGSRLRHKVWMLITFPPPLSPSPLVSVTVLQPLLQLAGCCPLLPGGPSLETVWGLRGVPDKTRT